MSAPVVPPADPVAATAAVGVAPASAVANWVADVDAAGAVPVAGPTGRALRAEMRDWIAAMCAVTAAMPVIPGSPIDVTAAVIGHPPARRSGTSARRSRPSLVG